MEGDITDAKPVKFAGRADYELLLSKGIDLYEYQPSMLHTKVLVVDGVLNIFGSANFDNRSLELNDELNVVAFDRALATRLTADFEQDRSRSKKINLEEWRSRAVYLKALEKAWSLFGEVF
jgi:cardiolipin synthase